MTKDKSPEKEPMTTEPPPVKVTVQQEGKEISERQFRKKFIIGREDSCELQILSLGVSRKHAEVFLRRACGGFRMRIAPTALFWTVKRLTRFRLALHRGGFRQRRRLFDVCVEGLSAEAKTIHEVRLRHSGYQTIF